MSKAQRSRQRAIIIAKLIRYFTGSDCFSSSLTDFKETFALNDEFDLIRADPQCYLDELVLPLIGIESHWNRIINNHTKKRNFKLMCQLPESQYPELAIGGRMYNIETLMMDQLIKGDDKWNSLLFEGICSRTERQSLRQYLPKIREKSKVCAFSKAMNDATLLLYKMKMMDFYRLRSKLLKYNICSFCHRTSKRKRGHNFKKCGHCERSFYCSRRCQKKDWKMHRWYCHVYGAIDVMSEDILYPILIVDKED